MELHDTNCSLINLELKCKKWSRYVYNNQDFFVLFFENIKFLHILLILEMKKWGCRQSWVIIFLGVPPSRVAKGGGPT